MGFGHPGDTTPPKPRAHNRRLGFNVPRCASAILEGRTDDVLPRCYLCRPFKRDLDSLVSAVVTADLMPVSKYRMTLNINSAISLSVKFPYDGGVFSISDGEVVACDDIPGRILVTPSRFDFFSFSLIDERAGGAVGSDHLEVARFAAYASMPRTEPVARLATVDGGVDLGRFELRKVRCPVCGFLVNPVGHDSRCRAGGAQAGPSETDRVWLLRRMAWLGDALHQHDVRMAVIFCEARPVDAHQQVYVSNVALAAYVDSLLQREADGGLYPHLVHRPLGNSVTQLATCFEANYYVSTEFRRDYLFKTFPTSGYAVYHSLRTMTAWNFDVASDTCTDPGRVASVAAEVRILGTSRVYALPR